MNIQDKYTDSLKNRLNYAEENAEKVAEEEEKLKRAAQKEAIESEGRGPLLTNEEYDEKLLNENEFGQTGFNSDFQGPTLEPTDAERFEQIKDYDPRTEMPLLAVKGVIDTGANLADSPLNPLIEPTKWISGQERPYHALWSSLVPYKEDNDIDQTIRNLSGLIIPTMFGYGAVGAASKAVSANVMIGSGAKTIAELAARLGVDMTVAYHAGGSEHDANAAQTLNEAFGWNLPNATSDDDLPALRREKHRNEAVGMFAFSELLGLGGKLYRSVFPKGADAASQAIVDAAPKVNPEDPITSAHSIVKAERDTIFDEEVIRRMEAGPGNVGPYGEVTPGNVTASAEVLGMPRQKYDPFIHTKYAEPHETYIPNQGANAIDAKIDTAEKIYNPNYPQNGRSVPIVTEHIEKKHLNIKTAGARRDALYEVYESASPSVKAVKDGLMKYTPEEVNKAVDILYDTIANPALSLEDYVDNVIRPMQTNIYQGFHYLDENDWVVAAETFKQIFNDMLDPSLMRASGLIMRNAADNVTDIAHAVTKLPNKNTANLEALMWEKLGILAGEIRINQFISGTQLGMKNLMKNYDHPKVQKFLAQKNEEFKLLAANRYEAGLKTVESYKTILKENPEYMRPFTMAVDITNGDVETLAHLHAYASKNLAVFKPLVHKALNDRVDSWFVQGLTSLTYNSKLAGKAGYNAITGAGITMALKPISVTLGAARQLDGGLLQESLHTYGGIVENVRRAALYAKNQWDYAVQNPVEALAQGRPDFIRKQLETYEMLEAMGKGWAKDGMKGKQMLWNVEKGLYHFGNNPWARYGYNSVFSVDGFTKSMNASGHFRTQAYREVMKDRANFASKEAFEEAFRKKSDEIHAKYFDANGAPRDGMELPSEVEYSTKDMAFNLDSTTADDIGRFTNNIPLLKAIFSFPRTGMSALKYTWTYNPIGGKFTNAVGVGKMGKVFKAKTKEDMLEALQLHGYSGKEVDEAAFNEIKAMYYGRQLIGSTTMTLGLVYALDGGIRGTMPVNPKEQKAWIDRGIEPLTMRNPFTGKYFSYADKEPFTSILATIGNIVYYSTQTDSTWTEQSIQKLIASTISGPTQSSFLKGMSVLTGLFTNQRDDLQKFVAYNATTLFPWGGLISPLNRIITPQVKQVEQDMDYYMRSRVKFLSPHNDFLIDQLDPYTGELVNYQNPIIAALNEVVPLFGGNGGTEDWRLKMIESGWDGGAAFTTNPLTEGEFEPEELHFVQNWVAKHYPLVEQIKDMQDPTTHHGHLSEQSLINYRKMRAGTLPGQENADKAHMLNFLPGSWREKLGGFSNITQEQAPISEIYAHRRYREIHKEAVDMATNELMNSYEEFENIGVLRKQARQAEKVNDAARSANLRTQADELEKKYHKQLKSDFQKEQGQLFKKPPQ